MEKLVNFRDLGGYKTLDGQTVQTGKVLRSAEPVGLSGKDKNTLTNTYQLRKIIDFRSAKEVARTPDDALTGVAYLNIDLLKNFEKSTTSFHDLMENPRLDLADETMCSIYSRMVLNSTTQAGYARFLNEILTQEEGAVLFHCFAGKDRTGLGAALILSLLGVGKADIVHDYLLTNVQRKAQNQKIIDEAKAKGQSGEALLAIEKMMSVDAKYLACAFEQISDNYGTVADYAKTALNFEADKQAFLKNLLLTK
jgi:protein-tyrosine phosphatase